MAKLSEMHPELAARRITLARMKLSGSALAVSEFAVGVGLDISLLHQHDGSMMEIAWNDVQAILNENRIVRNNEAPLIQVPDEASEGYNQHHHTSQYDGGTIFGMGPHCHTGPRDGNFCFSVFYPSTMAPLMAWE
jgi:hypothetical protein